MQTGLFRKGKATCNVMVITSPNPKKIAKSLNFIVKKKILFKGSKN